MEELLPCPFCGGEAEICDYDPDKDVGYREPYTAQCSNECCCLGKDFRTREEAVEAWNHRAQQEQNRPLTLEELRQMDGESVWVQDLLIPRCSAWHFAIKHDGEIRLFDAVALGRRIVGYNATTGENYGKTWLAYRCKPEQEANRNG